MRIGIFNKYIAKSWAIFFSGILGILTLVIFMNNFIRVVRMAMRFGTSWGWIAMTLLNMLPDVIGLSAPMAFQISILFTLFFFVCLFVFIYFNFITMQTQFFQCSISLQRFANHFCSFISNIVGCSYYSIDHFSISFISSFFFFH